MTARGLIVAAPHSGGGKTTVTLALLAALRRCGLAVRGAKAGPDYIDPAFHAAVTGAPSVNLDSWAMSARLLDALAANAADGADLLVIEGVKSPKKRRLSTPRKASVRRAFRECKSSSKHPLSLMRLCNARPLPHPLGSSQNLHVVSAANALANARRH